ncbi:helix-turn-helix domain-containing protein [Amycolatopsis sp. NBC_01286]|uniref:helix-turn-helix domain-containing protein n=1 Tax=Amycolatopsis sp. NBC_01286 TaxID=2903560 RepID=UPI002E11B179|nr:helix-turn-helix domain-containing protein [Amycolatopsis sp. NBC_01286]
MQLLNAAILSNLIVAVTRGRVMSELGDRMRSAREAVLVSLPSMARRTRWSEAYLQQIEAGDQPVEPRHVAAYATALRVPVEALYGSPLWVLRDDVAGHRLLPGDAQRVEVLLKHPRSLDHAALETLSRVLADIRRLEDKIGATHVIPLVDGQRRLVGRFAAEARPAVRSETVGLLSELEQYRGWLAVPGRQWQHAGRHFERAAHLAMEADDPQRLSTALSFSAYRALRRREFRTAEALSAAARRDTRVDPGLRTYETFQRAEILARIGDHPEALRLLAEADGMVDQLPPAEELPPSGYWYTPPFFLGQRAFVLYALGDDTAAGRTARDCLAEMPAEWTSSEWAARRRELARLT